jgi:hypothetical protein
MMESIVRLLWSPSAWPPSRMQKFPPECPRMRQNLFSRRVSNALRFPFLPPVRSPPLFPTHSPEIMTMSECILHSQPIAFVHLSVHFITEGIENIYRICGNSKSKTLMFFSTLKRFRVDLTISYLFSVSNPLFVSLIFPSSLKDYSICPLRQKKFRCQSAFKLLCL